MLYDFLFPLLVLYILFLSKNGQKFNIHVNVFRTINDKKLQWSQYRVNNRIFTTNTLLKKNNIISKFCVLFALEKRKRENLFYTNVKKYRDFNALCLHCVCVCACVCVFCFTFNIVTEKKVFCLI